jgi:amino acid adenylation domain-containing protein
MPHRSVLERFHAAARQFADQPALELPHRVVSYGELAAAAGRRARQLTAAGTTPGGRVAVLAADRGEVITAMLAIFEVGGVFVPLDPEMPDPRLQAMLEIAAPAAAVVEPAFLYLWRRLGRAACPVIAAAAGPGAGAVAEEGSSLAGGAPGPRQRAREKSGPGPDDLCYVVFTSGSTGVPKAIAGCRKGIDHFISWQVETFGIGPGTRVSQLARPSFDAFFKDVFAPLVAGGTVCVPRPAWLGDGTALARWLDSGEIEILHAVPSLFRTLLASDLRPELFPRLRHVLLAGERLLPADVDRWCGVFGERIQLANLYGPSETTITKLVYRVKAADAARPSIPIGQPMPGARALIVDRQGRPSLPGAVGEILIRTPYRSLGYLDRPDLTAAAFVPNPLGGDPADLVYRTGDFGRVLPDGDFEFLGRRDQQVKIRGVRIELAEIEERLRRLPAVADVAVVDRADAAGNRYLCAYVVGGSDLDPDALRAPLARELPEPMVPTLYVQLDELPRTLSGKVDRRALPDPQKTRGRGAPAAPRTPLQETLAGLYSTVLGGVPVGPDDSFFALGGHSLLATQLLSRVREALGVELALNVLFESPTVAGLAGAIAAQATPAARERTPSMPRGERPPLSFAQQRIWFLDQLAEGNAGYIIFQAARLTGGLDLAVLRASLGEVVRRHEALRTTFPAVAGLPYQAIAPPAPIALPLIDLSRLPPAACRAESSRLRGEPSLRPFDLARGPLLRASVLRLDGETHALHLAVHHIVADAWSLTVMVREIAALYRDLAAGRRPSLPELQSQYADYAVGQRARLQGDSLAAEIEYWRGRLAGLEALRLPADGRRESPSPRGGLLSRTLPVAQTQALLALGRRAGATLFMVLLAAFQLLLSRLAGEEDVVVGVTIAGRLRRETEELIGFFVNTLPLRTDLAGNPSFLQLLARVREVALGAYAHQELPFEKMVEMLQPERDLGANPLFDVLLNQVNTPQAAVDLPGITLVCEEPEEVDAKFALNLTAVELEGGLALHLTYRRDLFTPGRIDLLLGQLTHLLAQIGSAPQRPIGDYSLVTPESQALLPDPSLALPEPVYEPVTELFFACADAAPARPAAVRGERAWSYGELAARARELAAALGARGLDRGDVVALAGRGSFGFLAAMTAVLASGAVLLHLDAALPPRRRRQLCAAGRARLLLEVGAGAGMQPWDGETERDGEGGSAGIPMIRIDSESGLPAAPAPAALAAARPRPPTPEEPAFVVFTSGSTGRPQAVLGLHKGLSHFVAWQRRRFGIGPRDRCAQVTSLALDVILRECFVALTCGAALCLPDDPDDLSGATVLAWLERERASLLHTVPSLARAWLADRPEAVTLAPLRWTFLVGEPVDAALVQRWRLAFPASGGLVNLYGTCETNMAKCFYEVPGELSPGAQPAGFPLPESQLLVLGAGDRRCGLGEPGEIAVRTPFLAAGYLDQPGETACRFVPNPFGGNRGERIYRTGDLGRTRLDGALEVLGRLGDQVKIRGLRIDPGEVAALLAEHPAIGECAVVAGKAPTGEDALVACFAAAPGADPGRTAPAELASYLARRLPAAMVPARFVALAALPRLPTGKVDRRALPPAEEARVPEGLAAGAAPRTPVEEIVAAAWSEVLGCEAVSRDDNFFALGGHSLLATQVVSRLERALGVRVPLRRIFEAPRLADLARAVEEGWRAGRGAVLAPIVRQSPRPARVPLSFAQQRLWLMDRQQPGNTAYVLASAIRLTGRLDAGALARALREVVRRHEVLRTSFPADGEGPMQAVAPDGEVRLERLDLRALAGPVREAELRRRLVAAARRPFDLARGPLLRLALLRLAEAEHALLLTVHHAVFDGWSRGLLVREVVALYEAFSRGGASPLPELPIQYADLSLWQRRHLGEEALAADLAYWRRQLAGPLPALRLPTDRPRPPRPSWRGARRPFALPDGLAGQVQSLARREGATLFMVLLAGFTALLHRYTGQDDLVIGTDVANRNRAETEELIGFFVNQLVLRTDLSGNPSFGELLARVREVVLGAYAHQDLPFDRLVEALNPRRDAGGMPLFQVKLGFLNVPAYAPRAAGLEIADLELESATAQYDLLLYLGEAGGRVHGFAQYSSELFDPATIDRLLAHFQALLAAGLADPARGVLDLPLEGESPAAVTAPPERQAVAQFNFE